MPSTDIDGSVIVILTTSEALRVYHFLRDKRSTDQGLDFLERKLADKITRDLSIPSLE